MYTADDGDVVFRGGLLTLLRRKVTGADGRERMYEIVEHPPAVAVVALRRADGLELSVALVRQLRPAIGGETWELPAGLALGDGESLEAAARRELREEAGAEGGAWSPLGDVYTSPGFTDERVTLFLAHGVTLIPNATPDPTEITGLQWVPLSLAIARLEQDSQADAKTALGLLLARDRAGRATPDHAQEERRAPMFTPESATPFTPPTPEERAAASRDGSLRLENFLLQEYAYVTSTAYQALEDRARMFNLYLVLIGALATGVGIITQLGQKLDGYSAEIIVALLAIMGVVGIAFFIKLIRLRQAWRESAITMNIIKEHYIQMFKQETPVVERIFRWRLRTLPTGERRGNISFVVCMTVALLGSLSFAAATLMALATWASAPLSAAYPAYADLINQIPWVAAVAVALLSYALHQTYFNRALNKKREAAALRKAVREAGLPESILDSPATK